VRVRFSLIALGVFGLSGAAAAFPTGMPTGAPPGSVIVVNDLEGSFGGATSSVTRATPAECRARSLQYRSGECVAFAEKPPAVEPEKAKPPLPLPVPQQPAKPKTAATTPASKPPVSPATPPRAAGEKGRTTLAAKPLVQQTSRVVTASPKADAPNAPAPAPVPSPASLRAMTGQLLLSGFTGRRATDPDVIRVHAALAAGGVGGVIVGPSNISSAAQLRELLLSFKGIGSPPLIAVDQEGGPESALEEERGFAFYPSAKNVGQSRTPSEARILYREMAAEIASLGVTLNIGPALGACREERADFSAPCFATSESRARAFAAAFTQGHHDRGLLTALRREPFGKGAAASRLDRASVAMLRGVSKPEAADAAILRTKPGAPSWLTALALASPPTQSGASRLRSGMGFGGAIIADLDLAARGAPLRHGEAVVSALQAGADLVLVRATPDMPADLDEIVYEAVEEAVVSGRLPRARIEDAYRQALRLKDRLRSLHQRTHVATVSR